MATEHNSWIKGLGVKLDNTPEQAEAERLDAKRTHAEASTPAAQFKLNLGLALEEAGILDPKGRLTPMAINNAILVVRGASIGNPAVIEALTANGQKIEDWAKFATQSVEIHSGHRVQVHFYKHTSGEVNYSYERDFKVTGVEKVFDAQGTELRKKDLEIYKRLEG